MRKKDKRKKSDQELLNESDSGSIKKDTKNDNSASTSRSRSRQRRSLSSLFRRSGSRPRSEERRKENDHNVDEELSSGANPRTNPRDHLKRMTVREALVYDRRRGRSPNRRALRLEKKFLKNESNLNSELSASLPYLTDIVPTEDQTAVLEVSSSSAEARSGSTLPRSKRKKRSRLDGDSAQINSHTLSGSNISTNQILPLDKRKYLIKKDNENSIDMIDSIANSDHHMNPTLEHSKMSLDLHKSDITLSDSYNQFIALREKRSPLTLSPVDVPDSTPLLSRSKSPQERGRTTSRNDNTPSVLDHSVFSFMTKKRPSVHYDNHHQESIIPVPEREHNDHENAKRSSYVSPRRFSRATRPSVTSFKSDVSETSVFSNSSDPKITNTDVSGNVKVKYQRHFSRDRKKTADKQLTVNELETEPLNALTDIIKPTLTEPQKIDASTSMSDISLQNRKPSTSSSQGQSELQHKNAESNINETIIKKELPDDGENIIKPPENSTIEAIDDPLQEQENNQSLSPFLREVIVIDSNAELPDMSDNDHERVFRPIQTENGGSGDQLSKTDSTEDILEERKSENAVDNSHLISSDIQVENDTHEDHNNKVSKPKKNSKFSFKRRKSSKVKKNDKQKEALKETDEKEHTDNKKLRPVKSKKEKRKSKKRNETSSKENQDENKSLVVACENDVSQKVEDTEKVTEKKINKTKSILKKASKDGSKKTNKVKRIKRTSSLNNLADPRENQVRAERRQSLTISGKRSLSMDNINAEKKPLVKSVTLKDETSKINIETANDKTVKSSKPQPKLSLLAIITMRAKIARMKKARQAREANKNPSEDNESSSGRPEVSSNAENETETSDLSVAKVFYENEINTSIGKSDNSIEIIEATDKEVKDIVFEKQVQFSPFCDDTMSEEEMIKQRQRNTRLTSRRESKVRQRQKKVISCCKKFVAFLFSHIGLCSVVVAYCILGGVIFKTLEGESEIEKKKEIREITLNYTEMIYRLAFEKSQTKGNRENFKSEVNEILKEFSVVIHKQTKEAGWDGKEIRLNPDRKEGEPEAEPEQWSYPSSLLYAITVMTTIGYGHVAPKTDEGRIATIAYAVFGIPLTLLCLTNIGDVMAHGFRMLYGKVCCGVCCILFRPRRRRRLDPEKGISAGEERLIMQENEKSGEVIHVPTSVCLLLMSSYIMLGTILFAKWEGWDMVTGTYFCFITLSTIGFGDVVPGMSSQAWTDQNEKLVSCALYLVFGLSLIAMCFNLVQEDVKDKCKRLGKRLGIIDK